MTLSDGEAREGLPTDRGEAREPPVADGGERSGVQVSAKNQMTLRQRHARAGLAAAVVTTLVVAMPPADVVAQDGQPPPEVKAVIEGTWELVEWHVDGRILRPPEMDGRWMVHDGLVMATRHRDGPDGFESTAGYGPYRWGPTTWIYGYERSEDRRGPSPEEAPLRVTQIPMRTFEITREGDHLILEDADQLLRWDYDIPGRTFLLMGRGRQPIRKYRKVD